MKKALLICIVAANFTSAILCSSIQAEKKDIKKQLRHFTNVLTRWKDEEKTLLTAHKHWLRSAQRLEADAPWWETKGGDTAKAAKFRADAQIQFKEAAAHKRIRFYVQVSIWGYYNHFSEIIKGIGTVYGLNGFFQFPLRQVYEA